MMMIEESRVPHITRESLLTLEAYSRARNDFRANVLEHKKARTSIWKI
jgi:hypothetical protein